MIDRLGVCLIAAGLAAWYGGIVAALFAGLATMVVIGVADGIRLLARLSRIE